MAQFISKLDEFNQIEILFIFLDRLMEGSPISKVMNIGCSILMVRSYTKVISFFFLYDFICWITNFLSFLVFCITAFFITCSSFIDVHYYASHALASLWPNLQVSMQPNFK